jgi:hypothetical protein
VEHRHNVEVSSLHQLPAELMLEIIDQLVESTASILCMRLVARDFYPLFEVPFIVLPDERDAFKAALRRDDLAWFSRWEKVKGLDALSEAVCSACRTRHPKAHFSLEELARDMQQRICIGAKETARLCAREFSLNQISRSTLNTCPRGATAAVYISKSLTTVTARHILSPVLETVVAHVIFPRLRQMDVTFHFRVPASWGKKNIHDGSIPELKLGGKHLVRVSLPTTSSQIIASKLKDPIHDLYRHHQSKWYACACNSPPKTKTYYSGLQRDSETQGEERAVLSVLKRYEAREEHGGPGWHGEVVQSLVHQQNELNAENEAGARSRLYKATEKGAWTWEDVGCEKEESHSKST